jgi:hypothetical protein
MALNAYQAEKSMISKSLEKISDFERNCSIFVEELQEREDLAGTQLKELP